MGKKSEDVYNSKLQKSTSVSVSTRNSLSKTRGYPFVSPNKFGGSSSKSDFKISDSSIGGKVPIHGPRRLVKPSRGFSDEFEIGRFKFKVNKSQIMNYKAICNLAMSCEIGYVFILFDTVVLHIIFYVDAIFYSVLLDHCSYIFFKYQMQ
jgi:hypothetical protein